MNVTVDGAVCCPLSILLVCVDTHISSETQIIGPIKLAYDIRIITDYISLQKLCHGWKYTERTVISEHQTILAFVKQR